ncbi:uncharacterized protein GGS22DRAFT_73341 [Annulohypoxylon maeteangense]|uniref:uncharacterized protein n=1 Tax=Annulohypoxylon maeteangense TaxID=1927788 RepID=UPI002007C086|nr:uncharacterized protein GGS22DRAFT_73341 [Annulohypoxylon maeteangense]KAI0881296.1 hypothetical protein GGS22DRAFT_73341 [Annulohypoxylon maeteangense]
MNPTHDNLVPTLIEYTLDDSNLEIGCPLDNGRHLIHPRKSLGQLDMLPPELIAEILLSLDLPTLTTFRRVNCRAMCLVDSLPQYRLIFEQCPNVLRAIICVEAASFDCRTLFETLSTRKCGTCPRFGVYLYLITCKRVCHLCFDKYRSIPITEAVLRLGMHKVDILRLPLPRMLNLRKRKTGGRMLYLDRKAVLDAVLDPTIKASFKRPRNLIVRTESLPNMTFISAPFLNSSERSTEWGFYCMKCSDCDELAIYFRIKYRVGEVRRLENEWSVKYTSVCK